MVAKKYPIQFEQNDKLFKTLIENSWDVIILVDQKGKAIYASPSIVRMFGRDYKEFIGINGLTFLHPLDAPKVAKGLVQIIRNPDDPVHMEMRIRHKLGHYLWIEAIATNFLSDENVKGIVINLHNITALKEIEERKDEFISIASHELRTPITSLRIYLQLLKDSNEKLSQTKTEEVFEKINNQIQRLERLVNDLYEAARIREGKISFKKEKFVPRTLLKETAEEIERNFGTHKIIFSPKFRGAIVADKIRLQQAITNLLVNAIKFSPKADKIKVALWKEKGKVYISVTDYGIGIAKEQLAKIAERFYQADTKNKSVSGLGLGLYITFNIIKQHGGDISIKSAVGRSTTITFFLPQK